MTVASLGQSNYQGSLAVGAGYNILDLDGVEWKGFGDPGYQYTNYVTVGRNDPDTAGGKVAFYGATPVGQPSGADHASVTRNNADSDIAGPVKEHSTDNVGRCRV